MIRPTIELIVLVALCYATAANAVEITHLVVDNAHLIETGQSNYAISAPTLLQSNWKTVSINGDNAVIYSATCQQTLKSTQTMSDTERALIVSTRSQLQASESHAVNINNQFSSKRSSTKFSLDGSKIQVNNRGSNSGSGMSIFNNNGRSISKNDENNFSFSKQNLPNNLARVFVNNDIVTFVQFDGQVQMKPIACLQPAEQQLLQESKLEVQQAEEQFRQQMSDFRVRMRDDMQRMSDNLRNMFNPNRMNPGYNPAAVQANTYPSQFPEQQQSIVTPMNGQMNGYWGTSLPNFSNMLPFQAFQAPTPPMFGAQFPFGPTNSPFVAGFPFNG